MNIDDLTIGQAKQLAALLGMQPAASSAAPYEVGKCYFIRTVTHHYTGRLVAVHPQELVLEDAAWIASDGRFAQALNTGVLEEVEPFPAGQVVIGRGSIVDAAVWPHALLRVVK
jgi:hypothetical protein